MKHRFNVGDKIDCIIAKPYKNKMIHSHAIVVQLTSIGYIVRFFRSNAMGEVLEHDAFNWGRFGCTPQKEDWR